MDESSQHALSSTQPSAARGGCSCCAMGCTTMFVIGLLCLALLLGGTWWVTKEALDLYTSPGPVSVEVPTPSDEVVASANDKLAAIRSAADRGESRTVQFTEEELNAIIARHPDFAHMRGKLRVAMSGDLMTLEMSVPLREIDLPVIRDRWLNGRAVFGLIYHEDNFNFSPRSLVANDRDLPIEFLEGFDGAFDDSFNKSFDRSRRANTEANEFWENVKTLAIIDGTLVVTTKGAEAEETATPAPPSI